MANTTWNPSDKAANITLTGSNLIATGTTGVQGGVRAVHSHRIGKFYWEVTCNAFAGTNPAVGVAQASWSVTAAGGLGSGATAVGSCGYAKSGLIYVDGVSSGVNPGALTNGSLVCVAIDCASQLIWFRLGAAGNWNGVAANNPATGVGGLSIPRLGAVTAVYPAVSLNLLNDQVTANFGDSAFTGTVPSGFTAGFPAPSDLNIAADTQAALEQWSQPSPNAQLTQVAIEQWGLSGAVGTQAIATQVALEEWALASRTVELTGNLGGSSSYGRFHYGIGHYSRVSAFAPVFSADLTIVAPTNLAGGLAPLVVLAADLDIHVNRIDLAGDIASQIVLGGPLTVFSVSLALDGSLPFSVVLGASDFVSGPLWAASEPCPNPPWTASEPCPPPAWMISEPCAPVAWGPSRLCNG